eukprot:CAMPEP_0198669922 /NCGR_PEP_ID=MMETSP1467-20131203/78138_1 /TAXON_ID=1462469 /ORGANISM="unid. sp., Strain CCMP2135" /LENGTH=75 /DNA_ID=CAMNT_0044406683 /DNA_START=29 /DNA_END=253 /DNA_ORIENTATION=+
MDLGDVANFVETAELRVLLEGNFGYDTKFSTLSINGKNFGTCGEDFLDQVASTAYAYEDTLPNCVRGRCPLVTGD